jgi:hypothetical protein
MECECFNVAYVLVLLNHIKTWEEDAFILTSFNSEMW